MTACFWNFHDASFSPLSTDLSHTQPSYAGLKGGGGGGLGGGGGSGSDEAIRSILEQARREMEAQQAALEPILKASSSSASLSQRDLLNSPLTAPLPPYNPLALSLKKPPSSLLSSPSSPSPVLDFSCNVKREGRTSSGIDMSLDGALRLGRGSESSARSGSSGGVSYWREQWWSNMHAEPRRTSSSQTGEENHHLEDSKEVEEEVNVFVSSWLSSSTDVLDNLSLVFFREYWVTVCLDKNHGTSWTSGAESHTFACSHGSMETRDKTPTSSQLRTKVNKSHAAHAHTHIHIHIFWHCIFGLTVSGL